MAVFTPTIAGKTAGQAEAANMRIVQDLLALRGGPPLSKRE